MLIEVHPFKTFLPPKAQCIVLGTFPTHKKNWRFDSYYPGRSNFFWCMLSEIYRHPFHHIKGEEAAKERVALCAEKGIAISDTIYKCSRKVATSSKDSDLHVIEKMNIIKILNQHHSINTVILTGSSGQVSAHKIFFEHLAENKVEYSFNAGTPPIEGQFVLNGREIKTATLYSTSGINIGRYAQAVTQYKQYLPGVKS